MIASQGPRALIALVMTSTMNQRRLTSIGVRYVTLRLIFPAWNVDIVRVGVISTLVATEALRGATVSPTHTQVTPSILANPVQPRICSFP